MKPGVKRDRGELIVQLDQQLTWLERSAATYDAGHVDEAIRIATILRTLLKDRGASTVSLLTHLGIKKTVRFLSTATPKGPSSTFAWGITRLEIGTDLAYVEFKPTLDAAQVVRTTHFDDWWAKEIIYASDSNGLKVSRSELILWASEKDGGAHVDGIVPETYRWLEEGAGGYLTYYPENDEPSRIMPFKHAHLSAIRQMAYEILNTEDLQELRSVRR